ncbi:MAG: hypothetical protein AAGA48_28700 [Myxococcota bacterium]
MPKLDEKALSTQPPGYHPTGQVLTPWPRFYHDRLMTVVRADHDGRLPMWAIAWDAAFLRGARVLKAVRPADAMQFLADRWGVDLDEAPTLLGRALGGAINWEAEFASSSLDVGGAR